LIKKTLLYTSLICLFACGKEGITLPPSFKGETAFVKTFGGSLNDVAHSVVATADGGYAIAGYTQSNDFDLQGKSNTSFDFLVLKYDANDALVWKKTYGGSNDDRAQQLINTSDGGLAVIGYTKSNDGDVTRNAGDRDYWIVKLDSNGNLSWQQSFGYLGRDFGTCVTETKDGGFLIAGELDVTSSGGQGNSKSSRTLHAGGDFWAIKLNKSGTKEWSKYYGGSFSDTPYGVVEMPNGNFIITGTSDSSDVDIADNKGTYDVWAVQITSKGTLVWRKNFGGSEIDEAKGIIATPDQHYMLIGNTRSSDKDIQANKGGADLWLLKIDSQGTKVWEQTLGGSSFDVGNAIRTFDTANFLLAGSSRSADNGLTNRGQNDAWIVQIDATGKIQWQKTIGGSDIDFCYDATVLNNGRVIAVGESTSKNGDIPSNKGFSDVLIIKLQ
jgi:hypothetical protein